ncbi:MAG: VOC family protein [Spirochaetaceae bacterium]|nr:VOC family protein [Spirochaetaceae bacterium]
MFKKLDHIGVVTTDMERFIDFYEGILGFKVRERFGVEAGTGSAQLKEVANLTLEEGAVIELFSIDAGVPPDPEYNAPPFEAGFRLMAVEVEDMDQAVEYLTSKGIEVHRAHKANPARWIKDPDGNMVILFPSIVYENYRNADKQH